MVSNWVLLATTILHVGLQWSVFVPIDTDRRPLPGTFYAGFMVYAGLLHFLQDMVLLPGRYRRRMGCLASFMIEVVLSAVVLELLALVCWANIEIIICKALKAALGHCGGAAKEYYQQNEAIVVGSVITAIAGAFWLSAARATDPWRCQESKQQTGEQTTDEASTELPQQQLDHEELQQQLDQDELQEQLDHEELQQQLDQDELQQQLDHEELQELLDHEELQQQLDHEELQQQLEALLMAQQLEESPMVQQLKEEELQSAAADSLSLEA